MQLCVHDYVHRYLMAPGPESICHAFLSWLLEAQKQVSIFITEELLDKNGKRKRKKKNFF